MCGGGCLSGQEVSGLGVLAVEGGLESRGEGRGVSRGITVWNLPTPVRPPAARGRRRCWTERLLGREGRAWLLLQEKWWRGKGPPGCSELGQGRPRG